MAILSISQTSKGKGTAEGWVEIVKFKVFGGKNRTFIVDELLN